MTKNAVIKAIENLGWGYAIIDNCDTAKNQIRLSCEFQGDQGEDEIPPADYYGRPPTPWSHIDKDLEILATEAGSYWEWENPAVISMFV